MTSLHLLDWEYFCVKMTKEQTTELLKEKQWVDRQIIVQWNKHTVITYALSPLNRGVIEAKPTFRQPTAVAYLAQPLPNMPEWPYVPKFVIRLPDLRVLYDDLDRVRLAYQQEYNLRDRFPHGTPDVLPTLLPCKWDKVLLESKHPFIELNYSKEENPCGEPNPGDTTDPPTEPNSGERRTILRVPCVIREYIEGKSLKSYIRSQSPNESETAFQGLEKQEQWFALAEALFRALTELHRERATHGFLFPGNIVLRPAAVDALRDGTPIPPGAIVFINAAESHRSVYFEAKDVPEDAKKFPVRRWYDSDRTLYRFAGPATTRANSNEDKSQWVRFDLEEASDYYSATDIFSLGMTLVYLAAGNFGKPVPLFLAVTPFDYVQDWQPGWQIVRGAHIRRRYHVMKAKLLDVLQDAVRQREKQKTAAAGQPAEGLKPDSGNKPDESVRQPADPALSAQPDANQEEMRVYEDSLRRAEVILQCVRSRMDRRISSPNHALNVVRMFRPADHAPTGGPVLAATAWSFQDYARLIELARLAEADPRSTDSFVEGLLNHDWLRSAKKRRQFPLVPAIRSLVGYRLQSVLERFTALDNQAAGTSFFGPDQEQQRKAKQMRQPFLRVMGSRATLVDAMLVALSSLSSEDEIIALTTANIFNDENFGPTSRITSMLQLLRLRGMPMRWVILVSSSDLYKPMTQRVLGFRAVDDRTLDGLKPGLVKVGNDIEDQSPYYSGFFCACLDRRQYERVLREKKTFIGFRKNKPDAPIDEFEQNRLDLHIAPDLSSRSGRLVALTFWTYPRRHLRLRKAYEHYRNLARPMMGFERVI